MKRILLALLLSCVTLSAFAEDTYLNDITAREIARRGEMCEKVGDAIQDDVTAYFAEAMKPPADDSHKWHISVITMRNCKHCDKLKEAFAKSPELRPFVDVENHKDSWAHYNVYQIEDQTQKWRFEGVKLTGYPTLIIQPPRNGKFGDPSTVVRQLEGDQGGPAKLAKVIRDTVKTYVATYVHKEKAVADQASGGPPFSVLPPDGDSEGEGPLDDGQAGPGKSIGEAAAVLISLLMSLASAYFGSNTLTNALLISGGVFYAVRNYRKANGLPLLIDDATVEGIVNAIKSKLAPKKD